jgi:hypothetical protein
LASVFDAEARRAVVVERALAHQVVRPHPLEFDPVLPAQVFDLHLALDPLKFVVGDAGHVRDSDA